ncbi:MAG: porin [Succinivibrio sp.]|nr:porin [Succinivibrio sp.]
MKKSVLAIAVAAAAMVASSAVSAAQVYNKDGVTLDIGGRVEALYMDGAKTDHHNGTIRDRARLNVKGTAKVTDWATAYGFFEHEWNHQNNSDEAADTKMRYAYVGVDFGKYGRVQAGRFEDALEWASDVTDKLEEDGCNALIGDNRNSGKIMYVWEGYGVHAAINAQTAINDYSYDCLTSTQTVKGGFSAALGYTSPVVLFGPISIRTGYTYTDFSDKTGFKTAADDIKVWTVGASWGTHKKGFYVATDYTSLKLKRNDNIGDEKVKGFEFLVSYGFDSGVVLNAAYSYRKFDRPAGVAANDGKMKLVSVTAAYNMTPNFRVWAEAHFDASSTKGYGKYYYNGDDHNCYMVGARYTF